MGVKANKIVNMLEIFKPKNVIKDSLVHAGDVSKNVSSALQKAASGEAVGEESARAAVKVLEKGKVKMSGKTDIEKLNDYVSNNDWDTTSKAFRSQAAQLKNAGRVAGKQGGFRGQYKAITGDLIDSGANAAVAHAAVAGQAAKHYFTGYGAKTGAIRGAAAFAAWEGANGLGRLASGGGMGHNNKGERDIAGIPFL